MQTHFTDTQRQDPQLREAEPTLRNWVHCGFYPATYPTYGMPGDESDGPRGPIVMMRDVITTNNCQDIQSWAEATNTSTQQLGSLFGV